MLRQRIITATVLVTLTVCGLFTLSPTGFGIVLLLILLLAAWEWSRLLGLRRWCHRVMYCALILGTVGWVAGLLQDPTHRSVLLLSACLYWCYVPVWLWRYAKRRQEDTALTWAIAGLVILAATWVALMALRTLAGIDSVLFLMMLIWVADSSAYFAGRYLGRHPLAPPISPGKTMEGAAGAFTITFLFALGGAAVLEIPLSYWPLFMLICLITVIFSIVGDLFESMMKRQHAVKDSGSLLPGHGGVLDRVDSLMAAAPFFAFGLTTAL